MKTIKKLKKTNKIIYFFLKTCYKQHKSMIKKLKKIWLMTFAVLCLGTTVNLTSCNVTRTITNESQYYQKGDTSVVIQTKTIETYDATKKIY